MTELQEKRKELEEYILREDRSEAFPLLTVRLLGVSSYVFSSLSLGTSTHIQ